MTRKPPTLSKSRFVAGLQCPLRLWYQSYHRDLAAKVSPGQQAIFDMGHEVGKAATGRYPHGIFIGEDYLHHPQAVQSTQAAMGDLFAPALFEAAYFYDGIRVRVDILERLDWGRWNLIEVKSSTTVKEVHIPDVAVQYYVLRGSGIRVEKAGILRLNNQYIYDGNELDLQQLFRFADLTEQILSQQEEIPHKVRLLKEMLAAESPPLIQPSRHCWNPYLCEFWDHCTAGMPEYWIFDLNGITRKKLDALGGLGVKDIRDIPDDFSLTTLQARIRSCLIEGKEFIDPQLAGDLKRVEYPLHFLDFETVAPAIPRYPHTRPFQTVPFQWSDYLLHREGSMEHREYLCGEDKDSREEFTRTLLDALGEKGTIFIYTAYEKDVVASLAEDLPQYRGKLLILQTRFKDLYAAIRKHFYHPEFHGSFSLKSVLPALVPAMKYESLSIQEGSMASLEYLRMLDPSTSSEEKERIRKDLLTYCGHDTLGMVEIREELLKRSGK
jgi:predicted RecB family nuclease